MPAAAWSRALAGLIMEFLIHSLSFHPWKELPEKARRENCGDAAASQLLFSMLVPSDAPWPGYQEHPKGGYLVFLSSLPFTLSFLLPTYNSHSLRTQYLRILGINFQTTTSSCPFLQSCGRSNQKSPRNEMMKDWAQFPMKFKCVFASKHGNLEKISGKRLAGSRDSWEKEYFGHTIQQFPNSQLKRGMPVLLLPVLFSHSHTSSSSHKVLQDPSLTSLII